ncbi:hypothetical protein E4U34_000862 [Claviceps purpurea]|nr:hypothetical protein E4U11_008100 [Claviceps purpurea]KAG6223417.1 hypothetical protein E4U34_000862 [Claviceps purpurea]KAG6271359.1 hypothetical protein E4U47_003094 [Claviceps purpurea]KAG6321099.1 hypothetical protein E4U44_005568 [Claviceps purpurea]
MKVTLFTLAVAGFAAAQNLDGLAPCVKSCIEKGLAQAGCSGSPQEIATCACKAETQSKLLAPVTQCATENKCNMADLVNAQKVAAVQCQAIAGGAGKSGMPSGAPSATHNPSAATPTAAATGAFPTNSTNNTKPAASSGAATHSGAAAGSSASPTGSESGSTESGSTGTATGTGAQPTVTNAAAVMGPAAGALVALFAAALAL